jgi:hypothetical protein
VPLLGEQCHPGFIQAQKGEDAIFGVCVPDVKPGMFGLFDYLSNHHFK